MYKTQDLYSTKLKKFLMAFAKDVWCFLPYVQLTGLAGDTCLLSPRAQAEFLTSHILGQPCHETLALQEKRRQSVQRDCDKDCYECGSFRS